MKIELDFKIKQIELNVLGSPDLRNATEKAVMCAMHFRCNVLFFFNSKPLLIDYEKIINPIYDIYDELLKKVK